jgi:hypothetical protein
MLFSFIYNFHFVFGAVTAFFKASPSLSTSAAVFIFLVAGVTYPLLSTSVAVLPSWWQVQPSSSGGLSSL